MNYLKSYVVFGTINVHLKFHLMKNPYVIISDYPLNGCIRYNNSFD
ncbi:hypothetical protein BD31_I1215 [Candidatus Nitrosopumilus salaria BD31]|uniref:Uncharacterized protein n=1 Tax=Candidatus Nitrosopumilus salarius BD31 TaxID=859350 RepID=I3D4S9_9ARCH|nr:hypothetical protein BD31_I1215 [Candidatus Nitrosopumilus salaria BD31]